ncbi:bifunctional methylenetetrahydrofolate dehydrogenase/methenyltetrahydrofolate cyclohydrolase FolD [Sphingopyxis sp. BSNA05]|uniref:bifunctional methylenetetrahydrofolate dehydrogenase/methenyltetrahydrofolate cyclohydrolase FolD n=1 Tax=Sphingopyxis sp. BSNA05 TaxID=1236614 RepID=UPI001563591A|nr:bifunctional methylenetetrahydrofolate dehydrogenase/methenyltetrahydrofolate cyclohydrolase FolD [Sphingopyxis sp. BSNA05]NRD88205.1 bifunctional methylenetetrahydrofolate dehydrogenase/methenyltetrahydrofolate cyclohydrolase FolD [Sphingopyxis sp. BSNA05]
MTAAQIIDGKAFAAGLRERIREAVPAFVKQAGRAPGLAVVLVGEDPASQVYVASKHKATIAAGMESFEHRLPANVAQDDLIALVEQLNADDTVDGILVQLPLPEGLDEKAVVMAIDPDKDVDGLHVINAGRLANGEDAMIPCTPLGSLMLLKDTLGDLTGLDAVVVGRSILVGKPMAQLLLGENCTVTMAHSRTRDLPDVVRRADIVVAAVGRAEMVKGDWLKDGAVVIDVGINRLAPEPGKDKGRLVGDVATAEAMDHVRAITPVPGGVGPMTIAVLLRNTLVAASARAGLEKPEGL